MGQQSEVYYKAAVERIQEALHLQSNGYYVLAMYTSGLAVECMLRAYRLQEDSTFDERHDLLLLWKSTALANVYSPKHDRMYAALGVVAVLWRNDYRFKAEAAVRSHLKKMRRDRGIKGSFLKYNSPKLCEAAAEFINLGTQQWKRSNRK